MRQLAGAALAAALLMTGPSLAEGPSPFPDFSAKRIKPPTSDGSRRINVQITPQDLARQGPPSQARPQPPADGAAPAAPATPPKGRYGWFWDTVSTSSRGETGPGRLDPALQRLAGAPAGKAVAAPRLQQLQRIVDTQGVEILRATVSTRVSPALVLAVIAVESGGKADAVSGAGAEGLMQLMPATAARFGVNDSFDTAQNIRGGVAYLDWLMDRFDGDPILVLAGYNAGEGSVRDHDGVPPFAETRDYVPKVLAAYKVAMGLCRTPPLLISDGCVFVRSGT